MPQHPVIVLKFGGSVIRRESDLRSIVHEVYAHVREGARVVAVVSAIEGTTDRLIRRARRWGAGRTSTCGAALIATGEATSAALLGLALRRAGLRAALLDAARAGLRTRGPVQDAHATGLDVPAIERALTDHDVVVIPGFVGVDARGRTTLLGRGGTDLTALFVAHHLGARCRLVKDVDALYERDPADVRPDQTPPRAYRTIGWEGALALDGTIVQHKAVRFAREAQLPFEVGGLRASHRGHAGTCVGDLPAVAGGARPPHDPPPARARIALLGAGVVGLGVYRELLRLRHRFEAVGVLVRDAAQAAQRGIDPALLCASVDEALSRRPDVVIEALGGTGASLHAARATLSRGAHYITANKALIAAHGPELHALARRCGAQLAYSAVVGGAMPAIELARRAHASGRIVRIEGILNGTTNAIVCDLTRGIGFDAAVARAQKRGLAEADPSRDLNGTDAAEKLLILCREAGLVANSLTSIDWIVRTALGGDSFDAARETCPPGGAVRCVARAVLTPEGVTGVVRPEVLAADHPLARVRGAGNALRITLADGRVLEAHGTGAGRWPTTQAVIADLLDVTDAAPGVRDTGEAGSRAHASPEPIRGFAEAREVAHAG